MALETCRAYSYADAFDPTNVASWQAVRDNLRVFDPTQISTLICKNRLVHAKQSTADSTQAKIGLVYRIPTTVIVRTKQRASATCPIETVVAAQALQATVPDSRSAFVSLSTRAGPFTTTNLQYGFSNGTLVSYSANRPSEVEAAWNVIPTILNTVPQMVAQVIQARVNVDNAKTAL